MLMAEVDQIVCKTFGKISGKISGKIKGKN
jgi:hypothetical protein